jgi:hypothetical protein
MGNLRVTCLSGTKKGAEERSSYSGRSGATTVEISMHEFQKKNSKFAQRATCM